MHEFRLGERNSQAVGHGLCGKSALGQFHRLGILGRHPSRHPQFIHFGAHALHFGTHALHFHFHLGTRQMLGQVLAKATRRLARWRNRFGRFRRFGEKILHLFPFEGRRWFQLELWRRAGNSRRW